MDRSGPMRRPTFHDYLALWILKLAKLRRTRLESSEQEDYDAFYESFFVKKDEELTVSDPRMAVRRETINAYLEAALPDGGRLLDAGCGLGEVLEGLPERFDLAGFDYAKSNVEFTARRLGDRAEIKQGSIYEIPWDDDTFDACVCLEVLEHIEDDEQGVADIARVLKPGGLFVVAVPYTYYWKAYEGLMGHFRHYTRQSVEGLLERHGFTVEKHLANHPDWHQSFTRGYVVLRAKALTFGRLFGRKSPFTFRWPWSKETGLEKLQRKLEPKRRADAARNYAEIDTSTLIAARKGT